VRVAAVVDTNVWVSALLNPAGHPARLVEAARLGRFEVIASIPLLEELAEVMIRPRILRARSLLREEAEAYTSAISRLANLVPVAGVVNICRDPDDNLVLETALAGGATYIVSRDEDLSRDLDVIDAFAAQGVRIMTVAHFLEVLDGPPSA